MLAIKGVHIDRVSIEREKGETSLNGTYSLISAKDTVLAKQSFGDAYGAFSVAMSEDTKSRFVAFTAAFQTDLEKQLGLFDE